MAINQHERKEGLTHLQDAIIESRIRKQREKFAASLRTDDILQLAALYHGSGSQGVFFQDPARGSFNMCYFVQFPSASGGLDRWVVRIPLNPYLPLGAKTKLESEITTMMLISEKTTIPIPNVIAYAIGDTSKPLPTFAILEYMYGEKPLYKSLMELEPEKRKRFYISLADIFIQLRRLEFNSIGRLVHRDSDFDVGNQPCTIDINAQALEGLGPSKILDRYGEGGPLRSADDYINMLLDLADNAFAESRGSVLDEDMGEEFLYHLDAFRHFAKDWQVREDDSGPFVLVHGDFQPSNLLLNDEGDIVGVLDWEWSRVVPRQYFTLPMWLKHADLTVLTIPYIYDIFLETFDDLLIVIRARGSERYGNTMLADEWTAAKKDGGFLVANALESSPLLH